MDPIMLFLANVPYFPEIFAEIAGRIHVAAAAIAAGIGVGMVGAKAAEAVGRNPSANKEILKIGIIFAALAEGLSFIAIFLGGIGEG